MNKVPIRTSIRLGRLWAVLLTLSLLGTSLTQATPPATASTLPPFQDVQDHWARDDVLYLAGRGIVNGYLDAQGVRTIRPNSPMTRAEVVKTLVSLRGLAPAESAAAAFADTGGHWANGWLAAAKVAGIATGYPDGRFHPDGQISRAELAALIQRAYGGSLPAAGSSFADVAPTYWAAGYVAAAVQRGWIRGYEDGAFRPDQPATRAEAFTVVARMDRQLGPVLLEEAVKALVGQNLQLGIEGYLWLAVNGLEPIASKADVALQTKWSAVRGEINTAFYGHRFARESSTLERQGDLLKELRVRWLANTLRQPEALAAITNLLLAMRSEVEGELDAVQTALGVSGTGQTPPGISPTAYQDALKASQESSQALSRAQSAIEVGNGLAASINYVYAWQQAKVALDHLGIQADNPSATRDSDGDGLAEKWELLAGTSPFVVDTDGDGLTDQFEVNNLSLRMWPTSADTDSDGVLDRDEDLDGDGLTNLQEQAAGTNPIEPDTDQDGLNDGDELKHGTDPLKADTDGDSIDDGIEIRLGTNPLSVDSDGDGTPDGREQLTGSVITEDAAVTITGSAEAAESLKVETVTDPRHERIPGLVGPVVDVTTKGSFSQVRIEIPIAPAEAGDTRDLRIFYFDEAAQQWRPVEGEYGYDAERGVLWVITNHLSRYAGMHAEEWSEAWEQVQPCPVRTQSDSPKPVDLAVVIDASWSMQEHDPANLRFQGARMLINGLMADDRAAVLDFAARVGVLSPLTEDREQLTAALSQSKLRDYTDLDGALQKAMAVLPQNADPQRVRAIVLLTDGQDTWNGFDMRAIDQAAAAGVVVNTIGLGSDTDAELLKEMARRTGGRYYPVRTAADLPAAFERIQQSIGLLDSDGDGLSDCEEKLGMQDAFGYVFYSDPNAPDTDGDGLTDREEIGDYVDPALNPLTCYPTDKPHWTVSSDPRSFDSDDDGLDDFAEWEEGTNALAADSDSDGLPDYAELANATDPLSGDTDGDSYLDGEELADADLDPLAPDERLSASVMADHFARGVIFGDACSDKARGETKCEDTMSYLAGQITGGLVPIVGTVSDIRDTIANSFKGHWGSAALSLAGVVPLAGDAVKVADSVITFVRRTGKFEPAIRVMVKTVTKILSDKPGLMGSLIMEALIKIDGAVGSGGYKVVRRYLGDTALIRLTRAGVSMTEMGRFLSKLESTGVTKEYPQMISFIQEMTEEGGETLARANGKLTLAGRVTLNLKRAALAGEDLPPNIVTQLKSALGESELVKHMPTPAGGRSLIPPESGVRHVNGHGPDRLILGPKTIEVGEAKARSALRTKDLQNYIRKGTNGYEFNATYLDAWFRRISGGVSLKSQLETGKSVRFTLFTYAEKTDIPQELREVLLSGKPLPFTLENGKYYADVVWTHMTPTP